MPKLVTKKDTPAPVKAEKPVETAADRRNYLRRMAGWPVKGN